MKQTLIGVVVGALIAIASVGATGRGIGSSRQGRSVAVTGEARLVGEPDTALVGFGVQKHGKTVTEAETRMADVLNRTVEALQEAGVKKEDVATSELSISQGWDYRKDRPSGYNASTQLTVTIRDVSRTALIIDTAIGQGLNRLQGVSYQVRDPKWRNKALAEALDDARSKAEAIAAKTGRRLGRVLTVREVEERQLSPGDEQYGGTGAGQLAFRVEEAEAGRPATRALPGQRALLVEVEVVYSL
jgi:uncharacterized protein YggE